MYSLYCRQRRRICIMAGDSRKEFILITVANYFAISANDQEIENLFNTKPLNSFLDDGNITVLAAKFDKSKNKVKLLNKVCIYVSIYIL